jgi:hypothetical protein
LSGNVSGGDGGELNFLKAKNTKILVIKLLNQIIAISETFKQFKNAIQVINQPAQPTDQLPVSQVIHKRVRTGRE